MPAATARRFRLHLHRPLEGELRSLSIRRQGRKWFALVTLELAAGGKVIRVKPNNTSNLCSCCGALTPTSIGDEFRCSDCGHAMDRDWNAALNILARGVMIPGTKAASLPKS